MTPSEADAEQDPPDDIEMLWYQFLTSDPDILRSLKRPKSAKDYLLRMIADPLLDHTRLYRVALRRRAAQQCHDILDIRLTYHSDFETYMAYMSEIDQMIAEDLPAAYVLAPSVDAMCAKTEAGKVIVVSEVLRYYFYFMTISNLHLVPSDLHKVPVDVSGSALVIAVRTMNLIESLDFDLDPRGIIPEPIENLLNALVGRQMCFIIGHEYAHHALGHVGAATSTSIPKTNYAWNIYQRTWEEEFDADLRAISAVEDESDRGSVAQGGVLALLFIYFYETVMELLDPSFADIKTHPPTCERLMRVVETYGHLVGVDKSWAGNALDRQRELALQLAEMFQGQPNLLDVYGSVYLGSWRGPELVDRVDF